MIDLRFNISAPWRREFFRNLGCLHGSFTKHKHWELQHTYYSDSLVDCDFEIRRHGDHPGIEIGVGILGYGVSARIYDSRHADEIYATFLKDEHHGNNS